MVRVAVAQVGSQIFNVPKTLDDMEMWCTQAIWKATMRHIAYEGRCFVLSACQYATRANAPDQYACIQGNAPETVLIQGGSVIVSPLGEILAGPLHDTEGLLVANIDT
jgi:nitrilase